MTTVAVIGCTHAGTFATTSILAEHPDWTVHVFERNGTLSFLSRMCCCARTGITPSPSRKRRKPPSRQW